MGEDTTAGSIRQERSASFNQAAAKYHQQFLSDEEIGNHWIFKIFTFFYYSIALWFHKHSAIGIEKIPEKTGCLLIGRHTTHNQDIFLGITGLYALRGRVSRGLLHRIIFRIHPWVAYLGLVPGQRDTAVQLMKNGYVVGVLPGGGEEAMFGHENAYELHPRWGDRTGFAAVARDAGVPIIPIFTRNQEEIRFNPIFFILNLVGFTRLYSFLVEYFNTRIKFIGWLLKQIGMYSWFILSWWAIPVPVKTTVIIGDPLFFKKDEDLKVITSTCKKALQDLISKYQPHKHNYFVGLKERFVEENKFIEENYKDK